MADPFRFCPSCAAPAGPWIGDREFRCPGCGFRFFQNVAAACGVLLEWDGRFLFLVRAKEPSKGFLGLPGGFVDPGESVEAALAREVREEIGGQIEAPRFLVSFPNRYPFAGVDYSTCDLYFAARLVGDPTLLQTDPSEVEALVWLQPDEVSLDRLAFPSLRNLWTRYMSLRTPGPSL